MADTSTASQATKSEETPDPFGDAKKPGEPPPEVKRDRFGRYLIPHPDTGKTQSWTRATTFAKTVADMYNIDLYHQRLVVKGMSMRPDLYAEGAGTHLEDKKKLNEIADYAREAAGESAKARLGTALHTFTEKYDLGEKQRIPPPWDADVTAYAKCLKDNDIKVIPEYVEATVVIPKFGVAGTLDRLAMVKGYDLPIVDDLKTGASVQYAWMEIACQLYLYSQATHIFDHQTGELREMPKVDQQRGLVVHLPVGQATADLYEINLELGGRVAAAASVVRDLRKRKDFSVAWGTSQDSIAASTAGEDQATISAPGDDEWETPSEAPPAPPSAKEKERRENSKAAAEAVRAPSNEQVAQQDKAARAAAKEAYDNPQPRSPEENLQRFEELGVDLVGGSRYQHVKVGKQQYLVVDIQTGESQEFKLLRDAKARKKELDEADGVGMQASPSGGKVEASDEWDEGDTASKTENAETDEWDDETSEESAQTETPDTSGEVAKLKAELNQLRSKEQQGSAPAESEPAKRQWLAEIGAADDREALVKIFKEAKRAGEVPEARLVKMAQQRQAELDAKAAQEADDDDDW